MAGLALPQEQRRLGVCRPLEIYSEDQDSSQADCRIGQKPLANTYIPIDNKSGEIVAIRVFSPLMIFGVILACYAMFGIMTLFEPNFSYGNNEFWPVFGGIGGVGVIFFLKNLIAPLMLAITLAWGVFQFAVNDVWSLVPIYAFFLEALLFWAPDWVQIGYIWVSLVAFVASSLTTFT